MLNIDSAIKARHPLIWVTAEEFSRVVSHFTAVPSQRRIYRADFNRGLVEWNHDQKRWLGVLVEGVDEEGAPTMTPLGNLKEQVSYIAGHNGIMLLDNAHLNAEALVPYLSWIHYSWMEKFYADDPTNMGPMLVLVSHSAKVPAELARLVDRATFALPGEAELEKVVSHFTSHGVTLSEADTKAVVRAGRGLGEYEFISALSASLAEHTRIDPEAVARIKVAQLSAGSNLEIKVPKYGIADVGGLDQAKEILEMNAWMWHNPEQCRIRHTSPLNRIILVGVPGCGKSLMAEAAASALGLDLATFNVGAMMDRWVGSSEANMRAAFRQIAALAPIVLWSDEVGRDFSGGASSAHTDGGTTDRVHGTLLSGLQELPDNVFWMGAANSLAALPPEMLRSGRIDQLMFVGFPTEAERKDIFRIHLGDEADRFDLDTLASRTKLFTGAEIQTLIKQVRFYVVGKHHKPVDTSDIMEFIPRLKNRVWFTRKEEIAAMYRQAKTEWTWASSAQESEADFVIEAATKTRGSRSSAKSSMSLADITSGITSSI